MVAFTGIIALLVLAFWLGLGIEAPVDLLLVTVFGLPFAVVGFLLVFRLPRNRIAWLCLLFAAVWAGWVASHVAMLREAAAPGSIRGAEYIYALSYPLWVPGVAVIAYILLLFPDGKVPSPRWRKLLIALTVVSVLLVLTGLFMPGDYNGDTPWDNPLGVSALEPFVPVSFALVPLLALCLLASGVALALRYRRSTGVERAQLKWLVAAGALSGIGYLVWLVVGVLFGVDVPVQLFFLTIPTAIWYSITRHRLYELDSLLSRTISYALVLVVLAGVYAGAVFLLGSILPSGDDLVVAMATLGAAALFNPVRRRVVSWVERRFNRSRYDATAVVERLTDALRTSYVADEVVDQWQDVVTETWQPAAVGVWISERP